MGAVDFAYETEDALCAPDVHWRSDETEARQDGLESDALQEKARFFLADEDNVFHGKL